MKINGKICLNYMNSDAADLVFNSLEIDNKNYLKSELEENKITYTLSNDSLGTFLSTVDDLISSEIVVEKIIKNTNKDKLLYK
ncbi:KEOPS complex subunit Pcc1 [Methanobrevibacter sp.]